MKIPSLKYSLGFVHYLYKIRYLYNTSTPHPFYCDTSNI